MRNPKTKPLQVKIKTTSFFCLAKEPEFDKPVLNYTPEETYQKDDPVRNMEDLIIYKAIDKIESAPEKFDPEQWETTQVEYECIVKEPDFKQLNFAMSAMVTQSGKPDMVGFGNAILDVCGIKVDQRIKKDANMHIYLALQIADEYMNPVQVRVKKN